MDTFPILLSLRVAALSTVVAGLLGIALAWVLTRRRVPGRSLLESVLLLPLVLPPTVVGFYLLMALGRSGPLGAALEAAGMDIVFTWRAAVIAAAVASLPLVVKAVQAAFEGVDPRIEAAARTLRSAPRVFLTVTLPLAWRGILAGLILAFARGLGEFGITLMLAGSIPGRTQTVALAIYDAVQSNDLAQANWLALSTVCIVVALLLLLNRLPRVRL
ncbi:MAG: molybdenum ABC transporter permease subunit [candidate division NC10 bacterium RBG_16_65_8]|nr:MAG: molybdenum ABC transporter permease subunit [candidate division NC10 bacterium RBG_16_65_8]